MSTAIKNETLKNILMRMEEGIHKNTGFAYMDLVASRRYFIAKTG